MIHERVTTLPANRVEWIIKQMLSFDRRLPGVVVSALKTSKVKGMHCIFVRVAITLNKC